MQGIHFGHHASTPDAARHDIQHALARLDLADAVDWTWRPDDHVWQVMLTPDHFQAWTPGYDSLNLRGRLQADGDRVGQDAHPGAHPGAHPTPHPTAHQAPQDPERLLREIWIAMLSSAQPHTFPSADELRAAVRMRVQVVEAARLTSMDFHTGEARRPTDCWRYDEDAGFVLLPGCDLIPSLVKAMHPQPGGPLYAFSCYRATEYTLLLALAREAQRTNPALLTALTAQWQQQAVQSGRFHDVFLRELGSGDQPLPLLAYVPGDRIWFRNPDEASADVAGYEGSWIIYLGGNQFQNYWDIARPFTLDSKCVEVYHWRHGLRHDAHGEPFIDEAIVSQHVQATLSNPDALAPILAQMRQLRAPKGVYGVGGCLDASREALRYVCPATSDIVLPGRY